MAKFKAKADQMFEEKLKYYLDRGDMDAVEELFRQHGAYLEMIEPLCHYDDEPEYTDQSGFVHPCLVHNEVAEGDHDEDPHTPCGKIVRQRERADERRRREGELIEKARKWDEELMLDQQYKVVMEHRSTETAPKRKKGFASPFYEKN